MAENPVKYVPPDGFFGIQILQNSTSPAAVDYAKPPAAVRRK